MAKNTALERVKTQLDSAKKGKAVALKQAKKARTHTPLDAAREVGGAAIGGVVTAIAEEVVGDRIAMMPVDLGVALVSTGIALAAGQRDVSAIAGGTAAVAAHSATRRLAAGWRDKIDEMKAKAGV